MSTATSEPPGTPPETFALTCMRCRYLLRGLDPAGVCPECGLAIRHSLEDARLRAERRPRPRPAHPPLVQGSVVRLRVGAAGVGLMAAAFVGMIVWAELRAASRWSGFIDTDHLFLGLGIAYLVAAWMATAVDPPPADRPRWRQSRFWVRACAWAAPASAALSLWSVHVPIWEYDRLATLAQVSSYPVIPATAFLFHHLGHLATGSRLPGLSLHFGLTRFTAAIGVIFFCVGWPPAAAADSAGMPRLSASMDPCGFLFAFALYVYPVLLLAGFAVVLWAEARAARRR
jgi:hypothetical protein